MSVAGVLGSSLYSYGSQFMQGGLQTFQQDLQQLGQDLQSGNLSAAQSVFASLQQSGPGASANASAQSNTPIAQEFNQLSQDLQSGNLSAAQQDFATLQNDLHSQSAQGHTHHHHTQGSSGTNSISQLMSQLGQALQTGNLSSAQQAYSSLQEDFQQFAQNEGLGSLTPSSSNSISVSA